MPPKPPLRHRGNTYYVRRHASRDRRAAKAITCAPSPQQRSSSSSNAAATATPQQQQRRGNVLDGPHSPCYRRRRAAAGVPPWNPFDSEFDVVDLSVVVACYREEGHLRDSVEQLLAVLDACRWRYEVIFVDDASPDNTPVVLRQLQQEHPDHSLRIITHERNTGRGRAVTDGIRAAKGRVVGYLDIDLEVHARYIPSFVLAVEHGADVVTAQRIYKLTPGLLHRAVMSRAYLHLVRNMLKLSLPDTEAGYKFFNRPRVLPVLDLVEDAGWFWDTEILVRAARAGLRIETIPTLFLRRSDKASTVNVWRDSLIYLRNLWRLHGQLAREDRRRVAA